MRKLLARLWSIVLLPVRLVTAPFRALSNFINK
jgi:hypothetical protein